MRSNKFTDEQRAAILQDYLAGEKVDVIARRHGTSNSYPAKLAQRMAHSSPGRERDAKGWMRARKIGVVIA